MQEGAGTLVAVLRPVGGENTGKVRTGTVWHFEPNRGAGSSFGIALRDLDDLEPESYQATFCVTTTDRSSQRLLEQDARPVVLATNALLAEQPMFPEAHRLSRSFFLPVIVTTARLPIQAALRGRCLS